MSSSQQTKAAHMDKDIPDWASIENDRAAKEVSDMLEAADAAYLESADAIEQVRDIFSGKITNWKDVGGEDQSIILVSREEGSGTRAAFEEMVMGEGVLIAASSILQPSNGSIRTTVSTTPNSIGYLSFGYLDNTVKSISINGVAPTEPNAVNGTYPIVRPLNMLTNGEPTGTVKAFLDFILSEAGQKIVVDDGYISVK